MSWFKKKPKVYIVYQEIDGSRYPIDSADLKILRTKLNLSEEDILLNSVYISEIKLK